MLIQIFREAMKSGDGTLRALVILGSLFRMVLGCFLITAALVAARYYNVL
ncbi:hypothetical protein [Streptomyces sp. WAC06614]|nr:hypothetical protein [Streptomyces sp. WAC06614]